MKKSHFKDFWGVKRIHCFKYAVFIKKYMQTNVIFSKLWTKKDKSPLGLMN